MAIDIDAAWEAVKPKALEFLSSYAKRLDNRLRGYRIFAGEPFEVPLFPGRRLFHMNLMQEIPVPKATRRLADITFGVIEDPEQEGLVRLVVAAHRTLGREDRKEIFRTYGAASDDVNEILEFMDWFLEWETINEFVQQLVSYLQHTVNLRLSPKDWQPES